ncbi:MAG: hypothetical protein BGO09_12495 [Bacteroidetes bacterium 47-18]|nr:MAG: hypothetical protein BGO09_12495 [Bacteroidetes bacterium 47-18]
MRSGIVKFISVICFVALCAWTTKQINEIDKAEWLIGTWENKTPKGSVYETWIRSNDTTFTGKSYIINEKDTVVFENIRLVQEAGGLYYMPAVSDQNDGLPVRFTAKVISARELIFENPQHDFPQTISYRKITGDSLIAEISGVIAGKERRELFPMKRIRPNRYIDKDRLR